MAIHDRRSIQFVRRNAIRTAWILRSACHRQNQLTGAKATTLNLQRRDMINVAVRSSGRIARKGQNQLTRTHFLPFIVIATWSLRLSSVQEHRVFDQQPPDARNSVVLAGMLAASLSLCLRRATKKANGSPSTSAIRRSKRWPRRGGPRPNGVAAVWVVLHHRQHHILTHLSTFVHRSILFKRLTKIKNTTGRPPVGRFPDNLGTMRAARTRCP